MVERFYVETLGCPKNAVDSDKVVATLLADGLVSTDRPEDADLVVVNTCAFIDAARQESIDVALALSDTRKAGARLVVTGCMAERYGDGTGRGPARGRRRRGVRGGRCAGRRRAPRPQADRRARPPRVAASGAPRAVGVREGGRRMRPRLRVLCHPVVPRRATVPHDRIDRGRSGVVGGRGVGEIVLVAQDLAWYGRDIGEPGSLAPLLRRLDALADRGLARIRLLYLYPSEVKDPLVATMLELPTVVPYFDLSLQHASASLLRRMKRWGSGDRFLDHDRVDPGRASPRPRSVRRSSSGSRARPKTITTSCSGSCARRALDWAGFFPFSPEDGTAAVDLDGEVELALAAERLRECGEVQEPITQAARDALVGSTITVMVDAVDDDGARRRDRIARRPRSTASIRVPGADARARRADQRAKSRARSVPTWCGTPQLAGVSRP